jgi:hypothetical protein
MIAVMNQKSSQKYPKQVLKKVQKSPGESPEKSWQKSKKVLEKFNFFEKAQQDCAERPKKIVWNNQGGSDLIKKELFESDGNSR